MKHIRTFDSYKNVKNKMASVDPSILGQAITESVLQVGDLYKVRSMVDIPQSLINSYVKKVKDTTGKNLRQFFGDVEIAEQILQFITTTGLDIEKIPGNALMGGAQGQGQAQTQSGVQVQTQAETGEGTEAQEPAAQEPVAQAQPQGQAQPAQGQPAGEEFEEPVQGQAAQGQAAQGQAAQGQAAQGQAAQGQAAQGQAAQGQAAQGQAAQGQEEEEEEEGEEELPV